MPPNGVESESLSRRVMNMTTERSSEMYILKTIVSYIQLYKHIINDRITISVIARVSP